MPQPNPYPAELRLILWQTAVLLARLGSLILVTQAHRALNWAAAYTAPAGYERVVHFLEIVFFACFAVVYVHLAYDMMTVFVPALKRSRAPAEAG